MRKVVRRIAGRRTDPETGVIYHMDFDPAPEEVHSVAFGPEGRRYRGESRGEVGLVGPYADAILEMYKDKVVKVDGERSN